MSEEIKKEQASVRSFRVTDDVMSRFKSLQDEMGLTQDRALKMLVEAYELEQAKNAIPDRETEIANFQQKASELVEAFLHSLQLNQDAEARIRGEVDLQLRSKDETIAEYQQRLQQERAIIEALEARQGELEEAAAEVDVLKKDLAKAHQEAQEAKSKHEKQLSDKDSIATMLTEKLAAAEQKAKGYDELRSQFDALAADLKASQETVKEQKREFELQAERAARSAEKAQEAAVAAVKAEMNQTITSLRGELQTVQIEAERQLRASEKEAAAEIRSLEKDNASLREQMAQLRAELKAAQEAARKNN